MPTPPAAAPLPPPPAAPAPDAQAAALAAWLRSIAPQLTQLDAAVASIPGSGVSLAVLDRLASANTPLATRHYLIDHAASQLGISSKRDKLLFLAAALERAPGGS